MADFRVRVLHAAQQSSNNGEQIQRPVRPTRARPLNPRADTMSTVAVGGCGALPPLAISQNPNVPRGCYTERITESGCVCECMLVESGQRDFVAGKLVRKLCAATTEAFAWKIYSSGE